MKRRNFIKLLGGAGLVTSLPGLTMKNLMAAQTQPYDGLLLINFSAKGGFYQGALCDPKTSSEAQWGTVTTSSTVGVAGNLRYAPVQENKAFYDKYYQRMLVINGMKLESNGHGTATHVQQTGTVSKSYPSSTALHARIRGVGLPIPWVSTTGAVGGASGIQAPSRAPTKQIAEILAKPNKKTNSSSLYVPQDSLDIIQRYQDERIDAKLNQFQLEYTRQKLLNIKNARANAKLAARLLNYLPATYDTEDLKGTDDWTGTISNIHKILVTMQAGVCTSGSLTTKTHFDTHGLGLDPAIPVEHLGFTEITRGLDYLWEKAEELGIADRIVVHLSSDVGRGVNGRNHNTIASTVIMKKNQDWGDRVVGMSSPEVKLQKINPNSFEADSGDSGLMITSGHIQTTLRQILGIQDHALSKKFKFDLGAGINMLDSNKMTPWA